MLSIALFEPEIPQNTGTLMRLTACFGTKLHVIFPCGFLMSDKHLTRSGMSYINYSDTVLHNSYADFVDAVNGKRVLPLVPRSGIPFYDFNFQQDDILLLGKESTGLPKSVINEYSDSLTIPMRDGMDSINVAVSGAIVLSEAMRQLNLFKYLI